LDSTTPPPRSTEGDGWLALLERGVLGCLFAATLATALLVARSRLAPYQAPQSFGLVFWKWLLAFYVAAVVPALVAVGVVCRFARGRVRVAGPAPRWLLAVAALGFLGTLLWFNQRAVTDLLSLDQPARYRWLMPTAAAVSALGLVSIALVRRRWRSPRRVLALLAIAAGVGGLWPEPLRLPEQPVLAGALTGERVLLVGLDGAAWEYADQLIERGELPVLAALKQRSAWGSLATLQPTQSPTIWTSIFTGHRPRTHRIMGFTRPRIAGVANVLPKLRRQRGSGLQALTSWLWDRGVISEVPVNSDMRRVPAYWNIASAYGAEVSVIGVWPTWPAEEITGRMVTERLPLWPANRRGVRPERVTYPEALYDEISHLVVRQKDLDERIGTRFLSVTLEQLRALRSAPRSRPWDAAKQWDGFYARHETLRRSALHLLESRRTAGGPQADALMWFGVIDQFSHAALFCSELASDLDCTPEEFGRLSGVVTEAYRTADATLGEVIEAFGDGNVVVVSDHGFARDLHPETPAYTHRQAPQGVFLAAGPAFEAGRVEGLSVYEILPMLLRLKGFALADDLPGRVPDEVFTAAFLETNPAVHITSYGTRGVLRPVGGAKAKDDEVMQQLRELGYVE
jgi:hypothetical protein